MSIDLGTLLSDLNSSRHLVKDTEEKLKKLIDEFEARPEVIELRETINKLRSERDSIDEQVRTKAIDEYTEDGDKHPYPGVSIAMSHLVEITDKAAASTYVQAYLPAMMEVNWKALESYILKAATPGMIKAMAFARVYFEPKVRIATDLDKALATAPEVQEANKFIVE